MIHIQCEHCGTRLKVPDEHAGKSGRCPKCKGRVAVPSVQAVEPSIAPSPKTAATTSPSKPLDQQLLDLPEPPADDTSRLNDRIHELEAMTRAGVIRQPEYTGERRFAWPVDILLYPANAAGAGTLAIVVGIPAVMTFLIWFGGPLAMIAGVPFFLVSLLIGVYAAWYSAECVYDSAKGGVRAPMALDNTGDMVSRVLYLAAVYIVFLGPAAFYWMFLQRLDAVFWGLVAWAVFFFPMGLLAMVIQDSSSALNPFGLLIAIFRTFIPYVGLLILIGSSGILRLLISASLSGEIFSYVGWFLDVISEVVTTYLGLVMAHVLGRFYWRYRDRLDWGL